MPPTAAAEVDDDPFATMAPVAAAVHVNGAAPASPAEPTESFETAHPVSRQPSSSIRELPHSDQVESSLIGACLIDGTISADACLAQGITPESFFSPVHREVFSVIRDIRKDGLSIDASILTERLGHRLEAIGGPAAIFKLCASTSTTLHVKDGIRRVREFQHRRHAIREATRLSEASYDLSIPIADTASLVTTSLSLIDRQTVASPFQLWSPSQFIAHQPDPSLVLLGDGYVERGEWTSLVGIGGLGKTRLALHYAICQILGREFCGLKTHGDPQHAVFLSTENGVRRWKFDIEKFFLNLTEADRTRLDSHLHIQALTADDDGDLSMGNPDTVARLAATLQAIDPGIVIFDPFADMVEGDENKTVDLVNTLRSLRSLTRSAAPRAAIIIIHHARTGSQNVVQAGDNYNAGNFGRGSKALYSRVRCELQLAPQDRDDPNRLVLACGKANNTTKFATRGVIFDPETFAYTIDPDFDIDAWRDDVSGKRRQVTFTIAELVDIISEKTGFANQPVSFQYITETAETMGASRSTICRVLKAANEAEYVRKAKDRGMWLLGIKPISK